MVQGGLALRPTHTNHADLGDLCRLGVLAAAAIAPLALGLSFETLGDWQLPRFRADPANAGRAPDRAGADATRGGRAFSRRTGDGQLARRAVRQILRLPCLRLAVLDAELAEREAEPAAGRALGGSGAVCVAEAARLGLPPVALDWAQRRRADGVVEVESVE